MPEETQEQKDERDKLLKQAYTAATQKLREAHKDEFNTYYSAEAADRGVKWKPRLTKEDRAAEEFDRLITEFPELLQRVTPEAVAAMQDIKDPEAEPEGPTPL